jgi:hypothetical protein
VVVDGLPRYAMARLEVTCGDAWWGTRTVGPDGTYAAFPVSLYNSLPAPQWDGRAASCDVELFYDTWNRKSLYRFGGTLDTGADVFTIGAP